MTYDFLYELHILPNIFEIEIEIQTEAKKCQKIAKNKTVNKRRTDISNLSPSCH